METSVIPVIKSFEDAINYLLDNSLLDQLGIQYPNNISHHHENNEKIFDQLFFHGKFAEAENHPIGNLNLSDSNYANLKAFIPQFTNHERLKIFFELLGKKLISQAYYETQNERYQKLKTSCKYSIFKQLKGDHNEKLNNIAKLPLPKSLKKFLEEDFALEDIQTLSPRP